METSAKLYSLNYSNVRTYLFALLFVVGNIALPQICHLVPYGGPTLLPIYFFTLIAAKQDIDNLPPVNDQEVLNAYNSKWAPNVFAKYIIDTMLSQTTDN